MTVTSRAGDARGGEGQAIEVLEAAPALAARGEDVDVAALLPSHRQRLALLAEHFLVQLAVVEISVAAVACNGQARHRLGVATGLSA